MISGNRKKHLSTILSVMAVNSCVYVGFLVYYLGEDESHDSHFYSEGEETFREGEDIVLDL